MIEIVSIGDNLQKGNFVIHSRFDNAVNFVSENKTKTSVICIADEKVGTGPVNIVIKGLSLKKVQSLFVVKDTITINTQSFRIDKALIYDSKPGVDKCSRRNLKMKVDSFKDLIIANASENSMAFLLNDKDVESKSEFDRQLKNTFRNIAEMAFPSMNISDIDPAELSKMKGLGIGFTPSGDDFICGVLYGIDIIEKVNNVSLNELKTKIYRGSLNKNPITNIFKRNAFKGYYNEKLKTFVERFFSSETNRFQKAFFDVIETGATSGADMLTGLYFTLSRKL